MPEMGLEADRKRREERKLKRMSFNVHVPVWMLIRGFALLPKDAMLVACGMDDLARGVSSLVIHSSQFETCPESQMLPELMLAGDTDGQVWLNEFKDGEWKQVSFIEVTDG